ncbi:MAG: hypothetical protein JXD22_15250 [Sedimentisphaerales bacterium]|nr:hypothetical protein [Sedimentisphaerales bacterium]
MQDAPLTVEMAIEPGIGKEGFTIVEYEPNVIRIIGNDQRGILYGIGKFLRTSRYDRDGFTPSTWRGTSVPEKTVRGIYFATHFGNYYHTAPIEVVERYIEELGLWGVNCISMWYDMHHFQGADDPEAVEFRKRLKRYAQKARSIGLGVSFGVIGNEAYGNSPQHLRAVAGAERGGFYPVAVCPNKPGGMEYILKILGDHFDWCQDIGLEYLWIWPYDQGGCGCDKCKPWGSNGFIKCAKNIAKMAEDKLPGTKVVLSTWYFDDKEWQQLCRDLAEDSSWVDLLLAEEYSDEYYKMVTTQTGLATIGFPEISMHMTFPWGGFGATPLPRHLSEQWRVKKDKLIGGFPYSEGIYEDITKVTCAQLYWNSQKSVEEILSEYIAYEYSPEVVDEIQSVIATLEKNHHMRWWPGELEGVKLLMNWFPSKGVKPQPDPGAEEAYATVKQVDAKLPLWARNSWRWRILYIRAMLDAELKANGGSPNEACKEGFRELIRIYHVNEKSDPVVKPPLKVLE